MVKVHPRARDYYRKFRGEKKKKKKKKREEEEKEEGLGKTLGLG